MTAEAVAWAIGLGLPILTVAVLFLANWLRSISTQVAETAREVDKLRSHVAENYVRGHEIADVKRVVEALRLELTHKVDELLKAVHVVIGKQGS